VLKPLGVLAVAGVIAVAAGTTEPAAAAGFDAFNATAHADGVGLSLSITNLLPVNELLGPSTGRTQAQFSRGNIGASAVFPNPGDLIVAAPGLIAGFGGIPNVPGYPAQVTANYPGTQHAATTISPVPGLPAGQLQANADEGGADSAASLGDTTQGSAPTTVTVGSIVTKSSAKQVSATGYAASADSRLDDIDIAGQLHIGELSSAVTAAIDDKGASADPGKIEVAGAEIGGIPVAITDRGIQVASGSAALEPVVDALVQPLTNAGISVHTTSATHAAGNGHAGAVSGSLVVEYKTVVNGFPATLRIFLGQTQASIDVAGFTADSSPAPPAVLGADISQPPALSPASATGGVSAPTNTLSSGAAPSPARPATRRLLIRTTTSAASRLNFRSVYLPLLLTSLALLAASWWISRVSRRSPPAPVSDLRSVWRW
jgi:hypothetical protein